MSDKYPVGSSVSIAFPKAIVERIDRHDGEVLVRVFGVRSNGDPEAIWLHSKFLTRLEDPPENNPVGTVRQDFDGTVWIKTAEDMYPWKNPNELISGTDRTNGWTNTGIDGSSNIIGAVPGTPAWALYGNKNTEA